MKRNTILAIFISSIISLLILEAMIRILSNYSYNIRQLTFFKFDIPVLDHINSLEALMKKAPFSLEPNTEYGGFILNSKGFRTPEYQMKKSPDSKRFIAIGDSFVCDSGYVPYPEQFPVLLQRKLSTWLKVDVEVINLGLPCVGPQFEQKILELEGVHLDPDLIIWAYFVGNDFIDEMPLSKDRRISIRRTLYMKSYLCRLIKNSYILYAYLRTPGARKTDEMKDGRSGTWIGLPGDYDPDKPTFEKNKFISIQASRMSVYAKETFPWHQWESIQQTFIEIRDTCRHFKIPLLVVIIPDENQVNSDLLEDVTKKLNKTVDHFLMEYPQVLLTDFFKRSEIDYLDLLSIFKKEGEAKRLYTLRDTHWNPEGNLLAAETIFKYLIEKEVGLTKKKLPQF